jgi:hypothetical protein
MHEPTFICCHAGCPIEIALLPSDVLPILGAVILGNWIVFYYSSCSPKKIGFFKNNIYRPAPIIDNI